MPKSPSLRFAPHLEVLPVEGRGLVALGEHGCDVYSGPEFAKLGVLVEEHRHHDEIVAAFDGAEREAVAEAISKLTRAGVLLQSANGGEPSEDAAWWTSQRVAPEAARERIRSSPVKVRALGDLDSRPTVQALGEASIQVRDDAPLELVIVEDYLDKRLAEINANALEDGRSWMLAQPGGARILVGPVFSPERGPCWDCLGERLWVNRELELSARALAGRDEDAPRSGAPAPQRGIGPALIALEVSRWLAGARHGFESMVLSFDLRSWTSHTHQVVWRPQCPACGDADPSLDRGAMPIKIRRGASEQRVGRPLRGVQPAVTLERFVHLVDPLTGVVQSLRRTATPEHLHVYTAGAPTARVHGERRGWEQLTEMPSGGKGTTELLAKTSALCEALERYSGQFLGDEPRRTGTLAEFGDDAIAPNEYMHFSDRQFDDREAWNENSSSFRTRVPERFDPEEEIEWSPVWSLSHERERLLPTALCYYSAWVKGARFCIGESNGNAAGNTVEEAILHGILELVERDHVALWWYNRLQAPAVDLDTIDEPWVEHLRDFVAKQERELWALDLTADLGIPAAVMLASSAEGGGVTMGFGAHVSLREAVVRAGTELAQLGLGGISRGMGGGAEQRLRLDEHPFVRPDPDRAPRSCSAEEPFDGDVIAALEHCRDAIERQGLELLVLDQTRPDIRLPVVKVIVPGMRHFWPRLGPGRLYEVPVTLGWLTGPREEHELTSSPPSG